MLGPNVEMCKVGEQDISDVGYEHPVSSYGKRSMRLGRNVEIGSWQVERA